VSDSSVVVVAGLSSEFSELVGESVPEGLFVEGVLLGDDPSGFIVDSGAKGTSPSDGFSSVFCASCRFT
jgi:hypothetical protein